MWIGIVLSPWRSTYLEITRWPYSCFHRRVCVFRGELIPWNSASYICLFIPQACLKGLLRARWGKERNHRQLLGFGAEWMVIHEQRWADLEVRRVWAGSGAKTGLPGRCKMWNTLQMWRPLDAGAPIAWGRGWGWKENSWEFCQAHWFPKPTGNWVHSQYSSSEPWWLEDLTRTCPDCWVVSSLNSAELEECYTCRVQQRALWN